MALNDITATVQGIILTPSGLSNFDAYRVFSPTVTLVGNNYLMLYCGGFGDEDQIGLATSSDGVTWTRSSSDPVISNAESQAWASFREIPITLMYEDGIYKLWF